MRKQVFVLATESMSSIMMVTSLIYILLICFFINNLTFFSIPFHMILLKMMMKLTKMEEWMGLILKVNASNNSEKENED